MTTEISRRNALAAAAVGLAGAPATALAQTSPPGAVRGAATARVDPLGSTALQETLDRFAALGPVGAGSAGDNAVGAWLEADLQAAGFTVRRQVFDVPFFTPGVATIAVGGRTLPVLPQLIVTPTASGGLTAPLALMREAEEATGTAGAIAVLDLPFARHSSLLAPPLLARLKAAEAAGAKAIVIITTGPTREALALNCPVDTPVTRLPMAVIAPRDAGPVMAAARARQPGTLTLTGTAGVRPAFNLLATRAGTGRQVIVSTPRSGWGPCMGERGPGLAIFRALAATAATWGKGRPMTFFVSSGHEFENSGGQQFVENGAPPPDQVAVWCHLGAGLAARDWHEAGGTLRPLPSADPQRYLLVPEPWLADARAAFRGIPGLEAPYPATVAGAAGELAHFIEAGYRTAFGSFAGHRFHHAASDGPDKTSGLLVEPVARAFAALIAKRLAADA